MKVTGLDEQAAWTGELPNGTYRVKVTKADEALSQRGNWYVSFEFEIISGDHKSRRIWDNMTFSEKSMGRVRMVYDALGIPVSGDIDTKDGRIYLGKKCLVTTRIVQEEDNRPEFAGVMRDRVKAIAYAPAPKLADGDTSDELAAGLTEKLGATPAADDDDIPF